MTVGMPSERAFASPSWRVAGGLFAIAFALYASTIRGGYVDFDDHSVFLSHPELYGNPSLLEGLRQIFWTAFPREEPLLLRDLTWALESRAFGMMPAWSHHLGNVLLNALNVSLAYVWLTRLTRRPRLAIAIAAIWGLLAVHVEPVAWLMGRKDVLSAAFSLTALSLDLAARDLAARDGAGKARSRALYLAAMLAMVAAMLSKISALTLCGVMILQNMLLWDLRGRDPAVARESARSLLRYVPHVVLSLLVYRWYGGILHEFGVTRRGPGFSLAYAATLFDFLPLVMGEYARLLVLPLEVSISHAWPAISLPLTQPQVWLSRGLLLAMVGVTVGLWRWRRDLLLYWLAFFVWMVTYLNLIYIGIWVADRYVYLASLPVVALGVTAVASLSERVRRLLVVIGALLVAENAVLCVVHQRHWRTNAALWEFETSLPEPSLLAFHALAKERVAQAQAERDPGVRARLIADAEASVDAGLKLRASLPLRPSPYYTPESFFHSKLLHVRATALSARGAPPVEVLAAYRAALEVEPNNPAAARGAAMVLFAIAQASTGAEREEAARQGLSLFARYAAWAARSPVEARNARATLEGLRAQFPFLDPELAGIRARILGERP